MRPVGALDQNIRQHGGDQFARRVFIEERHGVDGSQGRGEFGALVLRDERAGGTFQALHAGVGIQRQDQDVAERSCGFEQSDVAGMQNIVAAVGEDHLFAGAFPFGALLDQLLS